MPKRKRDILKQEKEKERRKLHPSYVYSIEERVGFWEDAGRMCNYCDRQLRRPGTKAGRGTHFDHKVPIKDAGSGDPSNIVVCCRRCNQEKGGDSHVDFLERKRQTLVIALNRVDHLLRNI